MSPEDKRNILEQSREENSPAAYIADVAPECICENAKPVPGSPGIVQDDEELVRLADIPFAAEAKRVRNKLDNPKDLPAKIFDHVASRGLSVIRRDKADAEQYKLAARSLIDAGLNKTDDAGLFGVFVFSAREVRELPSEVKDRRTFCVYDTPEDMGVAGKERWAHADVFANFPGLNQDWYEKKANPDRIKARKKLFDAFIKRLIADLDEFEGGVLGEFKSKVI